MKNSKSAIVLSLPVAMGYYPAGIAFGVLMAVADLPFLLTFLTSLIVYSGAAQYAAIELFATGASVSALTINTAVINLRHVFYGLLLLKDFPLSRLQRYYCYFALTDESFSLMTAIEENRRRHLFLRIVMLNQFYWVSATVIGYLLGNSLNQLIPNLDFALACLFVILWYEQYQKNRHLWSSAIAILGFLLAKNLSEDYALLLAMTFSAVAAIVYPKLSAKPAASYFKLHPLILPSLFALLAVLLLLGLNLHSAPQSATIQAQSRLTLAWQIIAVLCMGAVTFMLRFAPAILPKAALNSPILQQLNYALPISVMAILVMSVLDLNQLAAGNMQLFLPQLLALCAVLLVYHIQRNVLLGMLLGVGLYNALPIVFNWII